MKVQQIDVAIDRWAVRQQAKNLLKQGESAKAVALLYQAYGPGQGSREFDRLRTRVERRVQGE